MNLRSRRKTHAQSLTSTSHLFIYIIAVYNLDIELQKKKMDSKPIIISALENSLSNNVSFKKENNSNYIIDGIYFLYCLFLKSLSSVTNETFTYINKEVIYNFK